MRLAALFVLLSASFVVHAEKLSYTRSFPGSDPPFFSISIDRTGALEYKESTAEKPMQAQMQKAEFEPLFEDAEKLDYFKSPLESGLKVANTGKKTFRYEKEVGSPSETTFNYSVNPVAQHLVDKMEQIAETERAFLTLDRTARFDKLGVNDALAEIESLWMRKQLAAPDQFLPLLNRIATHESYMHLARDRAARLKDEFQASAISPPSDVKK